MEPAQRRTFEPHDPMPEEYREVLIRLLRVHADTETSVIFPETDWIRNHLTLAPTPEERVIEANIYADEQRHGLIFYKLLQELGIEVTADYFRKERTLDFANIPVETWMDVVLLHFLTEKAGMLQLRDLIGTSYGPLARVVPRITREENSHTNIGYRHLQRLCATKAGRQEARDLLPKWYPAALDMFGSSRSRWIDKYIRWGLKKTRYDDLRQEFIRDVNPKLERLGLTPPDPLANRKIL
jgi:ring-1,2-phenylacetyl-CoA epoxidase subunit PaaA